MEYYNHLLYSVTDYNMLYSKNNPNTIILCDRVYQLVVISVEKPKHNILCMNLLVKSRLTL